METVFLCYRKGDAGNAVGRIKDRLEQAYGPDFVFEYTHDVQLAANFRNVIDGTLREVKVVLVAIGPEWLTISSGDGVRRLDELDDPVRVEVETAIRRQIPMIPLLVDGAVIPPKSELPASLQTLSDTNGLPIRQDPDFDGDVDRLIAAIDRIVGRKRRNGSRNRIGWFSFAAGVVLVPALVFTLMLLMRSDPVVPDVIGLTSAQADKILATFGIDITASGSPSEEPAGVVIDQDPRGGQRGEAVALVVSNGPVVVVPNVLGSTATDALALLTEGGFGVETVEVEDDAPAGQVVRQLPEPGVESATVLLILSSGPPPESPEIPNLIGLTRTQARDALPAEVVLTEQLIEDPAAEGLVLEQDPTRGEKADAVLIVVSAGPGLPVVPAVVGSTEGEAQSLLDDLGITVTQIDRVSSARLPGTVLQQDPVEGDRADQASLVVSTGPGPDQFAGTWVNVDDATAGLTRLIINSTGSDTAGVQAFVACDPSDCELGSSVGQVVDGVLGVPFSSLWRTTSVSAEFAGDLLLVAMVDNFAVGTSSGGTTYHVMTRGGRLITDAIITEALVARPDLSHFIIQQPELIQFVPLEFESQLVSP